ncbi:hypothetical protein AGDE_15714 [Angomonas deanei]|nr:hypothetical protein AGDE_15714 [Angomonas deanei]|eukprot:EPY18593.1 hypothetical protein AGDE_15714 [Angomonas deanei]
MDALNSITALPLDEQDHYKKCHGRLAAQVSDSSSSTDDEEDILSDAVLKTVYVNYPYRVNASNCNLVRRVRQNSNNSGRVSAAVSDTCWVNMECLLSLRDTSTVRNSGESIHGQSIFQDCVVGAGTAEQNLVSCVQCRKAHINSAMRSALEKTPVNSSSSNTANHNTRDDTYSYLLSAGDANGPRFYHQLNLKQYTMLCREVVLLQQAVHAFFDGIQTQ